MNRGHNVDWFFSLSLFLLFVIGSFFVITYEIKGYQLIDQTCQNEDDLNVVLAYLNTQLKANDSKDNIDLVTIDDITCLTLKTALTTTYIYFYDGYLYELYGVNDYQISLDQGERLFALDDLMIRKEDDCFYFSASKNGLNKNSIVYLHS